MPDLCYNCFKETEGGICANCGFNAADDDGKFNSTLRYGSILNGRYITGRVMRQGRCITSYIAEDYKTKDRVYIRECLPIPTVGRSSKNEVIIMNPEIAEELY